MRFSLLQKEAGSMYRYNAFNQTPAVVPPTMKPLIAPENFDPDAQEVNIVKKLAEYKLINPTARIAGLVSNQSGADGQLLGNFGSTVGYFWGETIDGVEYTHTVQYGNAFTPGSTKRFVIVFGTGFQIKTLRINWAVWQHSTSFITETLDWSFNGVIRYITYEDISSLTKINMYLITNNGMTGIVVNIPENVTHIGVYAFWGNSIVKYNSYAMVAPSVDSPAFSYYSVPLHVKAGATGYDVAPWNNTSIFSSVIYDL